MRLVSIRTTAILPVDLNSLLYLSEVTIANLSTVSGDVGSATDFQARAAGRCRAMDRHLWSNVDGAFLDYDWQRLEVGEHLSAATVSPLYFGLATPAQGQRVARALEARLLAPGGVRTTEQMHRQQWDEPNGWAPLQWTAVDGLRRYGEAELAGEVAHRWLATAAGLYERESKLVEKYVLHFSPGEAIGGAAASIRGRTASGRPIVSCASSSMNILRVTPIEAVPDGEGDCYRLVRSRRD
jgi:alpha,alpha-trehalase